jgi:hypothetical protein
LAEEEEGLVEAAAEALPEEEEVDLEAGEEEEDLVGTRDLLPKLLVRFSFSSNC